MRTLGPLQFPLLLLDRQELVITRAAKLLAADSEFSDVAPLDEGLVAILADSLQLPQDPVEGPDKLWNEAIVDLARSLGSIGVVGCQLRYLAAAASGILADIPEEERLETSTRLHWAMYFGLEVAARATAKELAAEAFHSEVTGLRNKRRFEKDMKEKAGKQVLHIAYLDMDGLKTINDTEGHDAGDSALRALGAVLSSELEVGYTAYHFSGDEFGILAIDVDLRSVQALIERVYSQANYKFSFGIATLSPGDESWENALQSADMAMQEQKKQRKAIGDAPRRPQ